MITASALALCTALMAAPKGNLDAVLHDLHWNGQSSIRLDVQGKSIAIDPYQIHRSYMADVVLITHPHPDHFSMQDLAKVVGIRTVIAAPPECLPELHKHFPRSTLITVHPGFRQILSGIPVEAVPAYNIVKKDKHPKSKGWVGYVLTVDGVRLYHAGDTERIPEMKGFTADIALLPLGQTYTMGSVEEAAQAAVDVRAKIAIPIHYGLYEGKESDAASFSKALRGKMRVIVLPRE
jgi:L-ascorbate metabolism protein UlaG (beta-lactamase superfamily)